MDSDTAVIRYYEKRALEDAAGKALDHAEVIGNVTAALIDLDATYDGNRVTFTFQSTNDAMSYIYKARRIVEERLAMIRELAEDHIASAGKKVSAPSATVATELKRKVAAFATLRDNWDSYGGKAFPQQTIQLAMEIAGKLGDEWKVVPVADGAIAFYRGDEEEIVEVRISHD